MISDAMIASRCDKDEKSFFHGISHSVEHNTVFHATTVKPVLRRHLKRTPKIIF